MNISFMIGIQILLFNIAFIFIYQPGFLFSMFRMGRRTEQTFRVILLILGILCLCALFIWSFYFGANLFLYKRAML